MPREALPPDERRSEQVIAQLTPPEKEAVLRVMRELGASLSTTGRYLINLGLAAHDERSRGEK